MLLLLLTCVTHAWATVTIYVVGSMQKNDNNWVDEKTSLYCHNWGGSSSTTWPGQSMTKWNDVTVDGHQVWTCNLKADNNTSLCFNNNGDSGWKTGDKSISAAQRAYPYPTFLNGDWVYSPRVAKVYWESATESVSGGYIYFDNTDAKWNDTYIYLVVGHTSWVGYYRIQQLAGTKLWYASLSNLGWDDAKFVALVGNGSTKTIGSGNPMDLINCTHFSDVTRYGLNTGTSYMISMSSGTNCTPISINWQNTGYTAYNSRQTVYKVLGSSTTTTDVGTVTVTTTKLTNNCEGTKDNSEATIGTSASSAYTDAVKTATVTLTASAKTGYEFVGWATSANGSTVSTETTFTYTATAATSYYAKFREKTYTVTISNDGHGTTSPNGAQSSIGQITGIAISAEPNDDYEFVNWTIESGTGSFADATDESTTFYPTSAATIQANFRSTVTNSLTVVAGTHVKTVSGSVDPVTLGNSYAISATAFETGYEFDEWTADVPANASFVNSKSSSTNVTVSNGSVTVTANAKETMRTITISGGTASSTTAGVATTGSATAAAPAAGKKFTGWNLGAGVTLSGCVATDMTITFNASADATVTAQYADRASVKMYFAKPTNLSWSKVYAYAWGPSGENKTYPGVELSTTEVINCVTYYIYQYYTEADGIGGAATGDATWNKIVFGDNDDARKTGDLNIADGHYYYKNSTSTGSASAITNAWYIKGTMNSWGTTHPIALDCETYKGTVSINLTKGTTYEFKVYDEINDLMWSNSTSCGQSSGITATMGSAVNLYSNDANVMKITPNVTGSYTFEVSSTNAANPQIKVTFPTSYAVNFGVSPAGAASAPTNDKSISDGGLVLNGTNVTFTHAAANPGYTWSHWEKNGSNVGTGDTYVATINAATTVTAVYTENMHTITVNAGEHGSITTPTGGTTEAGIATGATIVSNPASGYYFGEWVEVGSSGNVTFADDKASSTIVTATADATIQANFVSSWVVGGSFNSWNMRQYGVDHFGTNANSKDTAYVEISLAANTNYSFKIYDMSSGNWWGNENYCADADCSANAYINYADNNKKPWTFATGRRNCGLTTAGAGTYKFAWNITDHKMAVHFPTSWTVSYGTVTAYNADASKVESTTGGSISTVVDGDDNALISGKYVVDGGKAVFTHAAPEDGYSFEGWYSDALCKTKYIHNGSTVKIDDAAGTLELTISTNTTVYAKFQENMTTVTLAHTGNGSIKIGGVPVTSTTTGVVTTRSITAVPDAGYYFSGWTVEPAEGADYNVSGTGEANTTITLRGRGAGETTGQTLTANFLELNKVYFDNSDVAWENVYVYFGGYWDNTHGACVNSAYPAVAMTNLGDGIYWAYVPREITRGVDNDNKHKIAFSSTEETIVGDNAYFTSTKAAQRDDYFYNGSLSMYRPYRAGTGDDKHSCEYYKSGYWVQYYATIGNGVEYYMKINTDNNAADYEIDTIFRATAEGTNYIRKATVRLDNGNKEMNFHISTGSGSTYTTSSNITASNCTDITVKPHGGSDFTLTTTSEGIYTFYLDQSGPQMKLTAVYPASVGDYRVLYTNSSVTVPRTSDVIKTTEESSHTTTMFIDKDAAGAILKLQKCTAITDGNPVWTDAGGAGAATLLTTYASNFASAGVYKFTVNVTDAGATNVATSATCSLSEIEAYTGPYYIKTDCAPGGWANYTQNAMEQNTINAAGAGYDYYFCRWIESTKTNIKCVIATDYCDAVSDTLKTDDIINRGGNYETLPCAGSVRFSYDSKTNTLKRTYLQGANEGNSFCVLKPKEAGYVYTDAGGTTDMFASITKFKDNGNWTYQMDAYVYPGAKGGVYTDYPNSTPITRQELVDTVNNVLMGGEDKGSTRYHVRLVYDFKTDHLMSAWVAGAVANDIDLSSDFMYIRKGQLQADQISVASGKKITTAKKAYGVFQFSKEDMVGKMSTWNITAYQLCKYYFSFPFDVNVSDIFGVGTFGTDWRIQKYNGAKRAEKGWFAGDGTTTFWEDVTIDSVLHAYEGYLLMLNRINFNNGSNGVWTNIGSDGSTYLYFPSKDDIGIVAKGTTTVKVPSHECKIDRYFTQDLNPDGTHKDGARNHMITDSHWNMLGVPLFADTIGGDFTSTFKTVYDASQCGYLYTWDAATNSLSIANTASFTFNAMYAYMVQYTGDITFNGSVISPSLAARRAEKKKEYTIDLNLTKDDLLAGHTYVELREEADNLFMLNEDMYMVKDSKTADVYTFAGCYDVSANVLSVENHVIPVGVNVKSAGTYTFSMPSNFDGTVTLIDNFTQTRTNLAIEDYEVSLPKGEINDRFLLEINIRQVPTAIDGVEGGSLKDGKAHKFIENGVMYILRDGKIYDARGNRVK